MSDRPTSRIRPEDLVVTLSVHLSNRRGTLGLHVITKEFCFFDDKHIFMFHDGRLSRPIEVWG